MSACTCSPCGRTFSGLTSFDRHQDVDYKRRRPVVCQDPATLGMVLNSHDQWSVPLNDAGRAYFDSLKAAAC